MLLKSKDLIDLVSDELVYNPALLHLTELQKFREYYAEAGLARTFKNNFFMNHFCDNLQVALNEFTKNLVHGDHIVDLGGGMGTQAIFFAYYGFKVTVVDMDEEAVRICIKRKHYYEKKFNRNLDIKVISKNALKLDWNIIPKFRGIYSLFAFNMVQPTNKLLENIFATSFIEGGICIIQDGNPSHPIRRLLRKFLRKNSRTNASELSAIFSKNGFSGLSIPLLSFPPLIHFLLGQKLSHKIEIFWAGRLNLNISWLHIFKK